MLLHNDRSHRLPRVGFARSSPRRFAVLLAILSCAATCSAAPAAEDCALWLDFDKVVDNGFVCRPSRAACRVNGPATVIDGAFFASGFHTGVVDEVPSLVGTDELTLTAWVAPAKAPRSYQTILYKGLRKGPALQQIHFHLCLCEGRPEFKYKDAKGAWQGMMRNADRFLVPGHAPVPLAKVPRIATKRWSHVAATFNRGHVVLFLNGEAMLEADCPVKQLVPNAHPMLIAGAQSSAGHQAYMFPGLIDDVRIYNRALSVDELAALYQQERPSKPEKPLSIRAPLPIGYDPEFKTKLPLVAAYERNLPPDPRRKQVTSSVKPYRGVPMLHVDGKPVYSMAMMPEPYVSDELIGHSCRDFAAAGVDIYSEIFWSWTTPSKGCHSWWLGPGQYDFAKVDARIRTIIKANPRALIFPRLKLNPPRWWLKAHPDEIVLQGDGESGKQASLASELWEKTYERLLRDMVRHMESSDYAGHIVGYHPAGGRASEWFWWGKSGLVDYSPAGKKRLRKWLAARYGDVAALRRAWGDDQLTFETAEPPAVAFRRTTEHLLFRDPVKARPVVDYRQFLSDMVSYNIDRSCRIVKEETRGRKFAGVFYGYSCYCTTVLGFQGLQRVLASPHVDFLAAPTAYDYRRGGDPGVHISAYNGSYRLHNKLYWDEVDTRTHLYPAYISYRTDTLAETVAVLRRAFGYSLAKGTSLWWFLLAGNATFHQAEVMDAIAEMKPAADAALQADRTPILDVAVFVDEPSMLYTRTNFSFVRALVRNTLDELACMGAPFDVYLLNDITHAKLPEYKLYLFLNAFKVDDPARQAIDAKVKRAGKTAVWVYAPGYVRDDGLNESAMQALTGITLRAHEEEMQGELTRTDAAHVITAELPERQQPGWSVGPLFSVEDSAATVLGTSGKYASLAVKEFDDWRSVYSMLPLTRELLLGLCRYAGVHVYSETFDPFFANKGFAMIHTASAGPKRIALPGAHDVFDALTGKPVGRGITEIRTTLPAQTTRVYRLVPSGH